MLRGVKANKTTEPATCNLNLNLNYPELKSRGTSIPNGPGILVLGALIEKHSPNYIYVPYMNLAYLNSVLCA